ncbi:MAG: YhcH/YjgK/YiaL family protein [Prevotellaceae bacterium]|jgi:YhcH/YjgK/YiaL family protein|nr:YhcH/YjgK/YiaL family protein [Prevotellaceae bacterium]
MILDSLNNSGLYEAIHPRFKKAFDFLKNTDLKSLEAGKIELEGADLVVNIVDITAKAVSEARMETHNKFIDIQVPVGQPETMGWIAGDKLKNISEAYNPEKDITFFDDKASNFVLVQPYEFAIFFPEDGHQPGIGSGTYRKIIIKILR